MKLAPVPHRIAEDRRAALVAAGLLLLLLALSIWTAKSATAQSLTFDDQCTPEQLKCRQASIKRNEATTHPLLREVVPELVKVLGLDPSKRLRGIELVHPEFAAAFYKLVETHPNVLPLWDKKEAELNVRRLIALCEPAYDHKLFSEGKINGDRNACYLDDLRRRLRQRLESLPAR